MYFLASQISKFESQSCSSPYSKPHREHLTEEAVERKKNYTPKRACAGGISHPGSSGARNSSVLCPAPVINVYTLECSSQGGEGPPWSVHTASGAATQASSLPSSRPSSSARRLCITCGRAFEGHIPVRPLDRHHFFHTQRFPISAPSKCSLGVTSTKLIPCMQMAERETAGYHQ